MAREVFTGWRTVRPGACTVCGFDDGWDCDGRGNVFCDCQRCPDCDEFDGTHNELCREVGCMDMEDSGGAI